jgi:hypothetical protein
MPVMPPMLDVEGRPDVDARGEQLLRVLPALRVARAGGVRMRQLVEKEQRRATRQRRIEVELGQRGAAGRRQRPARQHLETVQLCRRLGAAVRLDDARDDIRPGRLRGARRDQHREGLADARRRAEIDAQATAPGLRFVGPDALDERIRIGTRLVHRAGGRAALERGGTIKASWPCGIATT